MTDGFRCESGWAIVRRLSPMSGNSEVVGGIVGKTRKGLHEDGTGRQLDFPSEYYRLWPSYLYYYRKNYGSISENMRNTRGR